MIRRFAAVIGAAAIAVSLSAAGASASTRPPQMKHRAGSVAAASPRNLSNVQIVNQQTTFEIQYHGVGNPITVSATTFSAMYQFNCQNVSLPGFGTEPACEWHNASGYCMDAGSSDGVLYAENCTSGYKPELWVTIEGPGGVKNPYWFWNVYWSQSTGAVKYLTPINTSNTSELSGDFGPGSGNYAVWGIFNA